MGTKRAFGHHHVTRRPADKRATVWLAMRQLLRFDIPTLVMTTEVANRTVKDFVYAIGRAGYLRNQRIATGTPSGSKFIWQLVRDTGPLPPLTRRNGNVYDQNTRKTYKPGGEELVEEARDGDAA